MSRAPMMPPPPRPQTQAPTVTSPLLKPTSIQSLMRLSAAHPVWLLTQNDVNATQWVLKAELSKGRNDEALNFSLDLMKQAGGKGPAGRTLDKFELAVLFNLSANPNLDQAECADIKKHENNNLETFVIMEYVPNLLDLRQVFKNADAQGALKLLIALEKPENLHRLGRIVAVDLFLGNNDRFTPKASEQQVMKNPSNVMFKKGKDGGYSIRGLDPVDPYTSWSKLDQDLLHIQPNDPYDKDDKWWGKKLEDRNFLIAYAYRILTELVTELKTLIDGAESAKHMFILGKQGKEGHGISSERCHVKMIVEGMEAARAEIKAICQARMAGLAGRAPAPAGLASRLNKLGW